MRPQRQHWRSRWLARLALSNPRIPPRWLMIIAGAALGTLILILIARPIIVPDDRVETKALSRENGLVARVHLEPASRLIKKLGPDSKRVPKIIVTKLF